jgi:hypothetical protein
MKKAQLIKLFFATVLILALSSCVSKKKKKCNTCPTWGQVQAEY